MRFGQFLREQRQARNLSLVQLARLSQTSASYLSRVERSLRNPPGPAILLRLAEALGTDYQKLMENAGYLDGHLREDTVPYGIPTRDWKDAVAILTEDDWADIWALVQNKVARRKQGHS